MKARRNTTAKVYSSDGSLTISEMDRREATEIDQQPITTYCAVAGCEDWQFEGTAGDARLAAIEHRKTAHARSQGRHATAQLRKLAERTDHMSAREPSPARPVVARAPKYTREIVIASIRLWASQHGRPPTITDWRGTAGRWPSEPTVTRLFGSWANGIEAAGFQRPTTATNYRRAAVRQAA